MRKFALLALLAAALAVPSIAAAATAQGKLTGSATMAGFTTFTIDSTVIDGGTSFVGLENDLSGNCDGDSGMVTVGQLQFPVACAHFVASSGCCDAGSPKMRFAVAANGGYVIVRITDNAASPDTYAQVDALVATVAQARECVNRGLQSGLCGLGRPGPWHFFTVSSGGFTVVP